MTEIYLTENHLLLEAGYGNPEMHRHSASHILVGLWGEMRVITDKEDVICSGIILPSGAAHTVDSFGKPFLVFLFDVTSVVSKQIRKVTVLEKETAEHIAYSYRILVKENPEKDYKRFFLNVMKLLGICEVGSRITDERITNAMDFVEAHMRETITAKDVAEAACLSESRFSHLFREQTGIAFSSYLVFRKLFLAYMLIADGASITDASLAAGFSSPSHFATVNKKMFGITARDLSGAYRLHKIADI
ncbi:MAG: AraC family transcriptional regulator [Bacteroides sp.]|nr:AraC family transcriptional regulator [Bacteroides sp.]MCM1548385.1 AraC family transcriptional regulator [Clostridium sp.]